MFRIQQGGYTNQSLYKNKKISEAESTNSLGVIIDSNLTWEAHTDKVCNKIHSNNLIIINRLTKITKLDVIRTSIMA
jgi:hypothetical protein